MDDCCWSLRLKNRVGVKHGRKKPGKLTPLSVLSISVPLLSFMNPLFHLQDKIVVPAFLPIGLVVGKTHPGCEINLTDAANKVIPFSMK